MLDHERLARQAYLTPTQAAEYLQICGENPVEALRSRVRRGSIPGWTWTRMGGSKRFIRSALDQWLLQRRGSGQNPDDGG